MTSPMDTVKAVYEAFERKDVPGLLALLAEDVEVYQAAELPWGGHHRGKEGVLTFLARLLERIESAVETAEMYEAGDRVVQVGRTRGRVRETGTPFDVREVHVWRLRDGRVAAFDAFVDTPAMLAALER